MSALISSLVVPYAVSDSTRGAGCSYRQFCRNYILRRGRPWPWSNRELSRITVTDCFGYRIWIIASGPSLTVLAPELVGLEMQKIQIRQGHWAVVDLIGKGGHIRTVPIPEWVKAALDQWTRAAGVTEGRIFRAVARTGKAWGKGISQNVVWYVVKTCCEKVG